MYWQFIFNKIHKARSKSTKTLPSSLLPPSHQNKMSTGKHENTLIPSPVARKLLEENNEKFIDDQTALISHMTKAVDDVVQNNRKLVEKMVELTAENERLKRSNAKLMMLVEMKEEDMGEHLDGLHVTDTVAQLAGP